MLMPSVPMANPVSSQSQPAPSITPSSFAIRAVSRRLTTPASKALITISREFWGGQIKRVFIICAIVVKNLPSVFVSTTPRQPQQSRQVGPSNRRAETQSVDFGRRPILLDSGIRATAGWTVACSLTRTEKPPRPPCSHNLCATKILC